MELIGSEYVRPIMDPRRATGFDEKMYQTRHKSENDGLFYEESKDSNDATNTASSLRTPPNLVSIERRTNHLEGER